MSFVKIGTLLIALLVLYTWFILYNIQEYLFTTHYKGGRFQDKLLYKAMKTAKNWPATKPQSSIRLRTKYSQQIVGHRRNESQSEDNVQIKVKYPSYEVPYYSSYKSMIADDSKVSNRTFPRDATCAYRGLRKPRTTIINTLYDHDKQPKTVCIPKIPSEKDCKEALNYYSKPEILKRKNCSHSEAISICSITEHQNKQEERNFAVSCDFSKCRGKAVMVGFYNENTGSIGTTDWSEVHNVKVLGDKLRKHVATSIFGRGFALLNCFGERMLQVLTLPGASRKSPKVGRRNTNRININLVLEDSLSRSHFYRTLPKTIGAFREIVHDQTIPATVLDFEMIQSTASTTVLNLQRLFTGRKYLDTNATTYGVSEFFRKFKKKGYTTMFQDCSCWYDAWGSILEPRQMVGKVKDKKTRRERWQEYKELMKEDKSMEAIDDFGMMFLTCSAYSILNATSAFDGRKLTKVCFYGRDYSSLFLEYNEKYVDAQDVSARPFFSYTHLYTSHESSGRRIVNDDEYLSRFVRKAAQLSNTVTIFASDHGGKSNVFSAYTNQGRHEVYEPLLFMIIPHQVAEQLGSDMDSLVVNQKRLVTMEDLHYTFLSLLNQQEAPITPSQPRGLFAPVPLNRTCEDLALKSDVLCLCKGIDKTVSNSSFTVVWAAEYAIGMINNKIQNQYITDLKSKHSAKATRYSGECQRYTGVQIMRPRQRIVGDIETLQFSLFLKPLYLRRTEVFDVQVTFPLQKENGIVLKELERVSMYNEYEGCADDGVAPKLCACSYSNQDIAERWQNEIRTAWEKTSFSLQPQKLVLDAPCLIIASRMFWEFVDNKFWQVAVVTYEALNTCENVTYELSMGIKYAKKTRLSITEPLTVTVYPRTMKFLMTACNDWKFGKVSPAFEFKRIPVA